MVANDLVNKLLPRAHSVLVAVPFRFADGQEAGPFSAPVELLITAKKGNNNWTK
jgi:hypothetical protein